ncbi:MULTISPECIES: hypothetical protein [unclassified Crossiella]|uniref:hypothetical protein n=1 Tax=unclassified Crossiella TaxID=2620835 RepID=UPI00200001AD|nr:MULTISPECIES: hypothetical protein [unclassified Crossiella]MCK2239271.1 hypothetical protein [Crossiella sp. S99.2]MCK2251159.1 hypothetical protein [Crossiella sp. S99.1]
MWKKRRKGDEPVPRRFVLPPGLREAAASAMGDPLAPQGLGGSEQSPPAVRRTPVFARGPATFTLPLEQRVIVRAIRPFLRPSDPEPHTLAAVLAPRLPELPALLRARDHLKTVSKTVAGLRLEAAACRTDPDLDLGGTGTTVAGALVQLARRIAPSGTPGDKQLNDGFQVARRMFGQRLCQRAQELSPGENPSSGNWPRTPVTAGKPLPPSRKLTTLTELTKDLPSGDRARHRLWADRLTPALTPFHFTRYPTPADHQDLLRHFLANLPELTELDAIGHALAEAEREHSQLHVQLAPKRQHFGMSSAEVCWRNALARELRAQAEAVGVGGALGVGFGAAFDAAASGIVQTLRDLADRLTVH